MMNNALMNTKPQLDVAVLMRREPVQGPMARWQSHRWVLDDVVLQEASFGQTVRCLAKPPMRRNGFIRAGRCSCFPMTPKAIGSTPRPPRLAGLSCGA